MEIRPRRPKKAQVGLFRRKFGASGRNAGQRHRISRFQLAARRQLIGQAGSIELLFPVGGERYRFSSAGRTGAQHSAIGNERLSETENRSPGGRRMLRGWTEIAAYCDRTTSTVKRWAAEQGLPVRRLGRNEGKRGVPVYADPAELDGWLRLHRRDNASGGPERPDPETAPAARFWRLRRPG
jgi:hypothetical protein